LQKFNESRLCSGACLHWQSQKRDPLNFGSGLAALPPRSLLPQLVPLQTQAPARSFRRGVLYDMQINIGFFVGHILLNKFLIKLFFTKDKWMGVKLYSCLMVTMYTYKFIS
jgi:hypothetical protein